MRVPLVNCRRVATGRPFNWGVSKPSIFLSNCFGWHFFYWLEYCAWHLATDLVVVWLKLATEAHLLSAGGNEVLDLAAAAALPPGEV